MLIKLIITMYSHDGLVGAWYVECVPLSWVHKPLRDSDVEVWDELRALVDQIQQVGCEVIHLNAIILKNTGQCCLDLVLMQNLNNPGNQEFSTFNNLNW